MKKYKVFNFIEQNQTLQIGKYKYFNDINLGYWVHNLRASYKARSLSKEKIELMESIPGWRLENI